MKRAQLNLALAAVVAGLGAAVYFGQEPEKKGPPLTSFPADAVTDIALEHPGQPTVRLKKVGSEWRLTEPVQAAADAIEVGGLTRLAEIEIKSTLEAGANPKDLGLEPAEYTLTLNTQKIEVGAVEPLQYRRYLRTNNQLVLTEDPPATVLDADYSDLASKQLLTGEIQSISLPGLALARAADGKSWTLTPEQADANSDQKQQLADAWKDARSMWNAALPEGASGETVTVVTQDGTVNFLILAREPQLVLGRPDLKLQYTLSKELVEQLLQLPAPPPKEEPAPAPLVTAPVQ